MAPNGSGGGILNAGTLALTRSVVRDNDALFGGGIFQLTGGLTLTGSTVSGNDVGAGEGGGLYHNAGTLTATNSTISGNRAVGAGGGLYRNTGTATLRFVTVAGNQADASGGGLVANGSGTTTLAASLVAGNTAAAGNADCAASNGGGHTSGGDNVVAAGTGCPANGPGDLAHTGALAALLAPLADNGGPAPTHALPPGSPALDRVPAARCGAANGADQRGFPRPQGPGCDSGAFETTYHTLTTGTAGAGGGTVAPASGGYPAGTAVSVAATPTGGSTFAGWTVDGNPAGSAHPLSVTMSANRSVIATFALVPTVPLTVATSGAGTVARDQPGTGSGPFGYAPGTVVALTPQPGGGQTFVGWTVDGANAGWAPALTLTLDTAHTVQATFAPTKTFADTGSGRADYQAVVALATRGSILGLNAQQYAPDQGVERAQMAALIARATPAGPGTAPTILAPPACVVAGTWDCDVWPNAFTDRDGLDGNLWRNIGALQHYGVTVGYTAADCARQGKAFPCFGPTNPVTYAETLTFITRAMVAKGYWVMQPTAPQPHAGVPPVFAPFVATFHFYAGGVPAPPANWNAGATRGWFARALWAALDRYWGTDGTLPDGRNAGGFVP